MQPFNFSKVPPIYFGRGKIKLLPDIIHKFNADRVLLVTGKYSLQNSGTLSLIEELLNQVIWERIICEHEPTTHFIDNCCLEHRGKSYQLVIGIGGGSVIDAGKAISAMLPHNNSIFDHLEGVGQGIPHSGVKIPYLAIPTTSGTGGEVTKNAVISEIGENGYKKSLRHDNLIPDAVIVDGNLLTSCPTFVTASCGMDALTQLLEPYLSPIASPLTDAIAFSGIEKIVESLLPVCGEEAQNPALREKMAYGALMSGIALANAGLGIVHGLASPLGGFFPIPHGVICGTLMAQAVKTNWEAIQHRDRDNYAIAKMAKVGKLLTSTKGKDEAYYIETLIQTLMEWTDHLKIPKLGGYGVKTEHIAKIVAKTNNRYNPIELTPQEIENLLSQVL
jgi:alcohol dehydrogenase